MLCCPGLWAFLEECAICAIPVLLGRVVTPTRTSEFCLPAWTRCPSRGFRSREKRPKQGFLAMLLKPRVAAAVSPDGLANATHSLAPLLPCQEERYREPHRQRAACRGDLSRKSSSSLHYSFTDE